MLQSSIARRLGSPGCLPQSHHRNASLLKTQARFPPSLQTASTCCHPRGKANLCAATSLTSLSATPTCLCYLLRGEHPQAKTAPKSSPSCPSTGTWRVGLMTLTKAVAEIPVLLLKADVEECMDTQDRQRFIRITGCVTKGS